MKIKFYWYFDGVEQHKLMPAVEIKCVDEKTINCLHGVLTDDAGINSIAWLEKGVEIFKEGGNSCNSTIWDRLVKTIQRRNNIVRFSKIKNRIQNQL